jgi:hypothetical protein
MQTMRDPDDNYVWRRFSIRQDDILTSALATYLNGIKRWKREMIANESYDKDELIVRTESYDRMYREVRILLNQFYGEQLDHAEDKMRRENSEL